MLRKCSYFKRASRSHAKTGLFGPLWPSVFSCVFEHFHFATLVVFAYHLSSWRLKKTIKNWCPRRPKTSPKTLFDISCVLEALPWRLWNNFGLLSSFQKEVLEASSRPSKTCSLQLGLLGSLQNRFWTPFGFFGAGFWTILEGNFSFKIEFEVCLWLLINDWQMLPLQNASPRELSAREARARF